MDYSGKRHFILNGSMPKVILTLATPIMFNNFIQTLYNLADTFWVSKLGSNEVAAMGLVFPFIFLIISIGMGMNVAGTALISQHVGNDDNSSAKMVAGQIFTFSLILSTALGAIGYFATPYLVGIVKGEPEVLSLSSQYLSIMFLDMPIVFLFFVYNSIKQGQGDTYTPMVLNVCGVLLNIVLDPIFIFTFGLGIKGAAFATIISRGIFAIYAIYTLFSNKQPIHLNRKNLKLKKDLLFKILKVGMPASIGQSAAAFGFIILNAFVISYGTATLAAFTIGNRINSLVLMPAMGIGSSIATIIGQNLGAGKNDRAKLAFKTSVYLSTLFMVAGSIVLLMASRSVVGIFVKDDPEVLNQGIRYLRLICIGLPLMGIFQILIGTFQGSGHTGYGMALEMGRLWGLRIPMIILFRYLTGWGSDSVWYAMLLSNFFICIVGYLIYLKGTWQEKVILEKAVS
ncbi:MATE family efflux transporter [Alkaliphilus peptidifermentans]|uniref:Putative efflux protein, MATE family n=1 Tax=Alkaliphilus peptidifermentans DSM 18978 TaxID=1120976 RepID=A0A1G5FJT2_9FIRM|nr:MATE family efflux transporter [Alkaliphilus peptidifermentans]SCY39529.1 putative efflux protein, MATE family [Alkaliphilus peptidifermentans DSM 18978]